jgi:hypothetical protein
VYAIIYPSAFGIATFVSPAGKYGLSTPYGVLIPFRKVAVPRARKVVIPIFLFFHLFTFYSVPSYPTMSTRSTASRKSQPPLRFPKVERPPVPPAGSSDLPHAAVLLPAVQAAQVIIPLQGKPTLPGSPPPSDEDPQALPDRRLIATPEEILQAQVRELDHVLREALDRLAYAYQRITQLEAESTRFRDNVLPVMESRIATMERLTVTRLVDQDSLAATRSGSR